MLVCRIKVTLILFNCVSKATGFMRMQVIQFKFHKECPQKANVDQAKAEKSSYLQLLL